MYISGISGYLFPGSSGSEPTLLFSWSRQVPPSREVGVSGGGSFFSSQLWISTFPLRTVNETYGQRCAVTGNRIVETNGEGRLVLQSLIGADQIVPLGGEGKNYLIKGEQLAAKNNLDDGYWGRVEISPETGNKTDLFLNFMYVCDADRDPELVAEKIETDSLVGGTLSGFSVLFTTASSRVNQQMTVEVPGNGNMTYYISGVAAGDWTVSVNGTQISVQQATEEGGLLVFEASAGTLTLTPSAEVVS